MTEAEEAIRVVVVEPGWSAWILAGFVGGVASVLILGLVLVWWGRRR